MAWRFLAAACGLAAAMQHAAAGRDLQSPPPFSAEQVRVEERAEGRVVRVTHAASADSIDGELRATELETVGPAGGDGPFRLRASEGRLLPDGETALLGALELTMADGTVVRAAGGRFDDANRLLALTGPVCAHGPEGSACADAGTLALQAGTSSPSSLSLCGNVHGRAETAVARPARPGRPLFANPRARLGQ